MTAHFGKVAVLMGGLSEEREVSLKGGQAVLEALQRKQVNAHGLDADRGVVSELVAGHFERVFIMLHGGWGEDGGIQGALEVAGLPYTGSGVLGSALAMDKLRCKQLWQAMGISTPEYRLWRADDDPSSIESELGLPVFVKPNQGGSSLGVSRVDKVSDLGAACQAAAQYDGAVLIERCIEGEEYTAAILGDQVWPLIQLQTDRDFYDYEAKYLSDTTGYHCPSGLSQGQEEALRAKSMEAFLAVAGQGWGRVDFMLDADGTAFFLEVNTIPGMTDHSLVPMAAQVAGYGFDDLVLAILETCDERH
ncbi:MAG TPA: D-alanine--D-alanine ligase [Acidiferrobacteraceae bacterium]|nr:D-alanine--D-alanine ligase [Acidiferrobacteraceae bacterium]